jgi:hypothetical protein
MDVLMKSVCELVVYKLGIFRRIGKIPTVQVRPQTPANVVAKAGPYFLQYLFFQLLGQLQTLEKNNTAQPCTAGPKLD